MPSLRRLRLLLAAGFAALPLTLIGPAVAAHAQSAAAAAARVTLLSSPTCPTGLTAGPTVSPTGGQSFIVCSGRIRSFDGTPLDTDVTIPTAASATPRPLMAGQSTVNSNAPTNEGTNTDPIANSGCRSMASSQSDPNEASYTFPVPTGTLVGAPIVNVDAAVTGTSAEVAARLWEINPTSGTQTLITRSVYRIEDGSPTGNDHLSFELWPQAWQFQPGDQVKLELTQDDSPVWRPDNLASSLTFTNLDLRLPLVANPAAAVAEAPLAPALPVLAVLAVGAVTLRRRRRRASALN